MGAVNPLRTWRSLDGGAKLAVYTRLSLQGVVAGAGVYLVVLVFLVRGGRAGEDALPAPLTAVGTVVVVVLCVVGIVLAEFRPELNTRSRPDTSRLLTVATVVTAVVWAAGVLLWTLADGSGASFGLYLLIVTVVLAPLGVLPWLPHHWPVTVVLAVVTTAVTWEQARWWPVFFAVFLLCTTTLSAWTVRVSKELDRARITESALQVSEERLRFAQELHDTLGQRLAAISVKTELARALAARGDDRLDAELADLQSLARTSVTEMHDVVDGYRTVDLSTEITGARELLESAGVTLTVEGDPAALPEPLRELGGWLVREATTNVVKHSDATRVRLTLDPDAVALSNDGAVRDLGRLSGLAGIRRRAEPLGASLVAERDGNLFTVTLRRQP